METRRPGLTGWGWYLLWAFGLLVLWAVPAAAIVLDSSSALYENFIFIGFSDPPSPAPGVVGVRQITGFGTVSSEIEEDLVAAHNGPFLYQAQSAISMDPVTGISFSGLASVSSLPGSVGLLARAHTEGGFADDALISAPGLTGQPAFLSFPVHVTGAASTLGADLVVPFVHVAQFSFEFAASPGCGFNFSPCPTGMAGLSTPGETLLGPVPIDQTVTVKVPFFLGTPFIFSGLFNIDAELGVPFDTSAPAPAGLTAADFSHTVTFGAATVLDFNGDPIPGAIVLSDFNFLVGPAPPTGVPEPATGLLLAGGVMAWGAARGVVNRRKRLHGRS